MVQMEIQEGDQEQEMKWQGQVWNHICGSVDSMVLKTTLELEIFDTIHSHQTSPSSGKPITLSELSNAPTLVTIKTQNLYRLLRYLAYMNLITIQVVEGEETFALADLSKLLLKNQEKSLRDWSLGIDDPTSMNMWHELTKFVSDPADAPTPFVQIHGKDMWELAGEIPELNELINNAMACDTRLVMPAFVQGCQKVLNGISSIVDIGGGNGTAMSYVYKAFPQVKCMVFDLPHVIDAAPKFPGVEAIGGDMFEFIPPADAIFLKFILHNWQDEGCIKLLKKCKETIPADKGKVIILDIVLDQDEDDDDLTQARLSLDIDMMLSSGGKERTKDEWRVLIEMAGYSRVEFIPIFAIQSVIVAYP